MKPLISVIVSTYNRVDLLTKCLQSLVDQKLKSNYYELIVVDNNSSDQTKQTIQLFQKTYPQHQIRYLFETQPGISPARNAGARLAKGKFLAFIDNDAQASSDWLTVAVKQVDYPAGEIFGGPILPGFKHKPPTWFKKSYETRTFGPKPRKLKSDEYLSGSNIFIKKTVFTQLGGFDQRLGMTGEIRKFGEETKLQHLARENKLSIFYTPKLKVINHQVPLYKTRLSYIFRTHYQHGIDRAHQAENLTIFEQAKQLIKLVVAVIKSCYLATWGTWWRNKHLYPYWQQYYWGVVAPEMFWLGLVRGKL